jgi:hypothetical protein
MPRAGGAEREADVGVNEVEVEERATTKASAAEIKPRRVGRLGEAIVFIGEPFVSVTPNVPGPFRTNVAGHSRPTGHVT